MSLTQSVRRRAPNITHGRLGLLLIAGGEALIIARDRPVSDFYFPVAWLGYVLLLDAAVYRYTGRSLGVCSRRVFLALFPISSAFWWLFELLNQQVHNWQYVGAGNYSGLDYAAIATLDFSFVVPAVWVSALFVNSLLPRVRHLPVGPRPVPEGILWLEFGVGLLFLALSIVFPRFAFGLIWGCVGLIVDPVNHRLGRPSVIGAAWNRNWRLPLSFALAALMCGIFWEAWNFWSMPKWTYTIPYVNRWHIFEMPLLGWLGYLPFGLELFAMTNFVLPFFGLGTLALNLFPEDGAPSLRRKSTAS